MAFLREAVTNPCVGLEIILGKAEKWIDVLHKKRGENLYKITSCIFYGYIGMMKACMLGVGTATGEETGRSDFEMQNSKK